MFQALRLLRGLWLHSPRSCEAAGKAGAVEALLQSFIKGIPDPTENTVAWQMARALEDWKRQVEQAEIDGTLEDMKKKAKEKKPGPPFRISCPGGFDEHGRPVGNELLFEFDFDDPEVEYGQPDEDEVSVGGPDGWDDDAWSGDATPEVVAEPVDARLESRPEGADD